MGCNSDYMAPTKQEEFHKQTAELLVYAKKQLGLVPDKEDLEDELSSYGNPRVVPKLCALLGGLTPTKREKLFSGRKEKKKLQLALWWEEHEAADKARRKKEEESEKYGLLMKSASEKAKQFLSEEEFAAVFKKKS